MNRSIRIAVIAAIALTTAAAVAQTEAQKAFATIKSMPGAWEGKGSEGQPLEVTFKVTAAGSAVLSEIVAPHHDMVSMIHLDGQNRLLLTHYCSAGNQPRMQASVSPDGRTITFNYVDATNLSAPDAGHMQRMVLTLLDDSHHTEEWTFVDHGQEHKETFDLRRKM